MELGIYVLCLGVLAYFIECAYENVALNKPAYQNHPYVSKFLSPDTFDASKAVDGLKSDLRGLEGQCSLSGVNKTTAVWWVNLTRIYNIHDIKIYYRTENAAWDSENNNTGRFLGFSLYISNTTQRSERDLCFKDTSFTRSTIPPVFTISCPIRGQYVIYYNERLPGVRYPDGYSQYAFMDLCEVEVYACTDEFFGQQCANKCNSTCTGCNIANGLCDTGCYPGWKGLYCHKKCSNNTYGPDCSLGCGHCLESETCHHINGTCLSGCDPGYKGETCDDKCDFGYYGQGCRNECSTFCKTPRVCHHVNGMCLEGCKSGWQGVDCLEVSKILDCEKNWKPEFQGVLGVFCIVLIITLGQTFYIINTRIRTRSLIKKKQIPCIKSEKQHDGEITVTIDNEASDPKYEELETCKTADSYDMTH